MGLTTICHCREQSGSRNNVTDKLAKLRRVQSEVMTAISQTTTETTRLAPDPSSMQITQTDGATVFKTYFSPAELLRNLLDETIKI